MRGKKIIGDGDVEYNTLEEAQDAVQSHDIWNESTKYRIIDIDTNEIEEEENFEDGSGIDDIIFPDEDSKEGFDVNFFFDRE